MSGRFAPTPSSQLHIGNLRTALVAWLAARSSGRDFLIRVEDLDTVRYKDAEQICRSQLDDLARLGLDHDGMIVHQKDRTQLYVEQLSRIEDLVYECFCSRKDIAEASVAPHEHRPAYPGFCRDLSDAERIHRRSQHPGAWRIRGSGATTVTDLIQGTYTADIDDFVVRRADGVFAYDFAVVVDDGLQEIDQVVRGNDLLPSAPRQAWLATLLGFAVPNYLHVPLVYNRDGTRLAKRDQALSLSRLAEAGISPAVVLSHLAASLSLAHCGETVTLTHLIDRFDPAKLKLQPWMVDPLNWK